MESINQNINTIKNQKRKKTPIFKKFLYRKYKNIIGNKPIYKRKANSIKILKGSGQERRIFNNLKIFYHKKKGFEILEYIPDKKEKKEININKPRKYLRFDSLGKGAFGECFLISSLDDGEEYAVKIVNKTKLEREKAKKSIIDEIKKQQQMNYPKIVKVKDFFEDKENVFIIQEFCKNKTLSDLLKRRKYLTEIEVRCYIFQLIQGLKYIHNQKIIHRDLKPNNILLDEKLELKIGDFGLIAVLNKVTERRFSRCGTRYFMAPEVYKPGKKGYSFEVDIWSMGIIMYNLLTGDLPFKDDDPIKLEKKIVEEDFNFPEKIVLSNSAKDLIKQILVKNPKKRPGLNQILFHDFFHIGIFPEYLDPSNLVKPPSIDEIKKKYNKHVDKNGIDNREVVHKKLYNLIVKDIPEVKYEDINTYNLEIKPKETFDYYISYFHKSHKGFCYYEINNGLKGIIFQNENVDNSYDESRMILNEKINKFYAIKTVPEDEEDIIEDYDKESCPEELKKKFEEFLKYIDLVKEKKSNIDSLSSISKQNQDLEKESPLSISYNESSESTIINENEKNNEKNEINEINENNENSESIKERKSSIEEIPLIYVKHVMIEKHGIFILLSNNVKQVIFHDKVEILLLEEKGIIGHLSRKKELTVIPIHNVLRNPNHTFAKRMKYIRQMSFLNIKDKLKKKLDERRKKSNDEKDTDE